MQCVECKTESRELFVKFCMITKNKPVITDGEAVDNMSDDDLKKIFTEAKGGMLFVDNSQKLIDKEGNASLGFQRFSDKIDQFKDDSIVLMAGLPFGLREFVKKSEHKYITGRFTNIFFISDYTPSQYTTIAENKLKKQGITLTAQTSEKINLRFRYLYKELKKPDSQINAFNGYLAKKDNSESYSLYTSRAEIYEAMGNTDEAENDRSKAKELEQREENRLQ